MTTSLYSRGRIVGNGCGSTRRLRRKSLERDMGARLVVRFRNQLGLRPQQAKVARVARPGPRALLYARTPPQLLIQEH